MKSKKVKRKKKRYDDGDEEKDIDSDDCSYNNDKVFDM